MKRLINAGTCPIKLHKLCLVRRFIDDLFVPDIPDFSDFMYKDHNAFGGGIYPRDSCELNCTGFGESCNFLDLSISQNSLGLELDIFDKRLSDEFININIIRMPHISSNISDVAKYGVIASQFYRFYRLCSNKKTFINQLSNLILLLLKKGYSFKKLMKKVRTILQVERYVYGISAFSMYMIIAKKLSHQSGELRSPLRIR
eukprot:c23974_g1_i1 orf=1111-1713(+)